MTLTLARSLGTHNGSFHADEVTACALLIIFDFIDQDKITRSRDPEVLSHLEFVCDVGGIYDPKLKRFDHHQKEYDGRLSSAGMVLQYLLDSDVIDQEVYDFLNSRLIQGVDEIDNGLVDPIEGHCSFSGVVANFVPISYEASSSELDEAFDKALSFVIGHIRSNLARLEYIQECKVIVKEEMDKKQSVLFFEQAMPWMEAFFELDGDHHPAQFIVMPTGDQWKLRGIPPTYQDRMRVRNPLPEKWAGLLEDDLKKESKIPGAIFCHKGRFISVWQTKEDVLKALKVAQEGA